MEVKKKNILYLTAIGIIILVGLYFRFAYFMYGRPLWLDEGALALNIINRPWLHVFQPLDINQACPPLFLLVSKFINEHLHIDIAFRLRLLPFICSCLSLPLFYLLAKNYVKSKIAVITAVLLFSLSFSLIYYSANFKQYACEVLCTVLIALTFIHLNIKNASWIKLLLTGIFYALCPWFGMSSIFVIGSVLLCTLLQNSREYKKLIFLATPFLISFGLFYLNQSFLTSNNMHDMWMDFYIRKNFSNIPFLYVSLIKFYFMRINMWHVYLGFTTVGLIHAFFKLKEPKIQFMMIVIAANAFASYLKLYPLADRIALYLLPFFIIIMAYSVELFQNIKFKKLTVKQNTILRYILCIAAVSFITLNLFRTDYQLIFARKEYYEDIDSVLKYVNSRITDNDTLFYFDEFVPQIYIAERGYKFKNIIKSHYAATKADRYPEFEKLESGKKYFYITSRIPLKEEGEHIFEWVNQQSDVEIVNLHSGNYIFIFTKK